MRSNRGRTQRRVYKIMTCVGPIFEIHPFTLDLSVSMVLAQKTHGTKARGYPKAKKAIHYEQV